MWSLPSDARLRRARLRFSYCSEIAWNRRILLARRDQADDNRHRRSRYEGKQPDWGVSGTFGRNTLGWVKPGSNDAMLSIKCEVREAGDEIVISLLGEPAFRTSVAAPRYGEPFDEEVRLWLLARLHDAVTNSDALPPEADNFREHRPFGSLEDAQAEAHRTALLRPSGHDTCSHRRHRIPRLRPVLQDLGVLPFATRRPPCKLWGQDVSDIVRSIISTQQPLGYPRVAPRRLSISAAS